MRKLYRELHVPKSLSPSRSWFAEGLSPQPILWREFPWKGSKWPITEKRAALVISARRTLCNLLAALRRTVEDRESLTRDRILPPQYPSLPLATNQIRLYALLSFLTFCLVSTSFLIKYLFPIHLVKHPLLSGSVSAAWISTFSNLSQTFICL